MGEPGGYVNTAFLLRSSDTSRSEPQQEQNSAEPK